MPKAAEPSLPLVQAARQHDTHAWNHLLRQHERPLYVYIAEVIGNGSQALDIVQETLESAVRHVGSLRDDAKFASWLFGIAHQKCIQHWRRQRRNESVFTDRSDDLGPCPEGVEVDDPFSLLVRQERQTAFYACIDRLPEPQRAIVLLRVLGEFSLQEISDITASPIGTVKSRLHHATQALRVALGAGSPNK
jgi:RNA polymerase sigma-70 factor (ECF subfamily)